MINKDIVSLYENLSAANLKGVKISYAIARNIGVLKPHIAAFQKSAEPLEDFKAFDKERMELCRELCTKDGAGRPVMNGNAFSFPPEQQQEFDTRLVDLKKKHADAIKNREDQIADFDKLLKEETEVVLHKVSTDTLPEDITTQQLTGIIDIIEK